MIDSGHVLLTVLLLSFAGLSAAHALIYKRDTRAVIAWVALIVFVPLAGAVFYWLLAVNRIERKAKRIRPRPAGHDASQVAAAVTPAVPDVEWAPLARVGDKITPFPLIAGNAVGALDDGDAAYPPMLEAIGSATRSITLASYIFDGDATGRRFVDELCAAVTRGVEVRVLVDAHGKRNRHGNIVPLLREASVPVAEFLPRPLWPTFSAFNLRNHRKLLVVDGLHAFTGGMNISDDNRLLESPRHPVRDLHFSVRGPVVAQLQQVFADDWEFTTGEHLEGETWFRGRPPMDGPVAARAIPDGPDEHFETLKLILLAALAQACKRVAIVTPYFLPDNSLIAALNTAALRGVQVDILLPARNDHRTVQWASQALFWQILERGCRIRVSPPPFDHSKLMLVDDAWVLIGSTNWDPRSLRLNFELNLECHDKGFAASMWRWFESRKCAAREVSKQEMDRRPLWMRLRDGAARLLTPYL